MAVEAAKHSVTDLVSEGIASQREWLDPLAEQLSQRVSQAVENGGEPAQRIKGFLNGGWLGHSLHPVLSDVPIGAWLGGSVLDLVGSRGGADRLIGLGLLAALPTAASGAADWYEQSTVPRRVGLVHAMFNGSALICQLASLIARASGRRPLGAGLSAAGLALTAGGAYLGGELVYRHGVSVNRNAWEPEADSSWRVAARADELVEGELKPAEVELDVGVPRTVALVLLKKGREFYALGGVCAHAGAPLADGKVVDEYCLVCPWHGSRFDLRTGQALQGPTVFPQPCYATRQRNGNIEVRRVS